MWSLGELVTIFQFYPFKHVVGSLVLSRSAMSDSEILWTGTLPGSSVHGTSQVTILEWVAIPFSRGSSWTRDRTHISCVYCIASESFTPQATGTLPTIPEVRCDCWFASTTRNICLFLEEELKTTGWLFTFPWLCQRQTLWTGEPSGRWTLWWSGPLLGCKEHRATAGMQHHRTHLHCTKPCWLIGPVFGWV